MKNMGFLYFSLLVADLLETSKINLPHNFQNEFLKKYMQFIMYFSKNNQQYQNAKNKKNIEDKLFLKLIMKFNSSKISRCDSVIHMLYESSPRNGR